MGDGGEGPGFGGFSPFFIGYEGSIAIPHFPDEDAMLRAILRYPLSQIGRASCRERVS